MKVVAVVETPYGKVSKTFQDMPIEAHEGMSMDEVHRYMHDPAEVQAKKWLRMQSKGFWIRGDFPLSISRLDEEMNMEAVLVPAGPFLMGSTEDNELAYDTERPQHTVELDAFRIGRYPVTNAEYAPFIEARGYENANYWTAAGWTWRENEYVTQPRYWENDRWNQPDHPVVGVSWYEALAYCRWLSEITGQTWRLPTEAEWEKAARGERGREWPWGNEFDPQKANTREGGTRRTTPVGQYSPEGDSPYGAADMAGNVWEWCSTLFREYPYQPDDGQEDLEADGLRVLRGGPFYDDQRHVRCAYRLKDDPYCGPGDLGFRVVSSIVLDSDLRILGNYYVREFQIEHAYYFVIEE